MCYCDSIPTIINSCARTLQVSASAVQPNASLAHAIGFDKQTPSLRRLNIDVNIIFVGFDKFAGETSISDQKITNWFGKLHKELLHADASFKDARPTSDMFVYDFQLTIGRMSSSASSFVREFIHSQRLPAAKGEWESGRLRYGLK